MTLKELESMWTDVLSVYRWCKNNDKTPNQTASMLYLKYGLDKCKEFCHAYCIGLENDGRLYPEIRSYVSSAPLEIEPERAYCMGNLVEIHPSHMNQIIQELQKIEKLQQILS